MWNWIILVLLTAVGIYDLYLYAWAKVLTITQRVHAVAKKYPHLSFLDLVGILVVQGYSYQHC